MGNFNREGKRSSGGFNRGFGGRKKFGGKGGRDSGRPTMHRATCDECNASCELPFRPTGDRPVFCSNCFGKQNSDSGRPNRFRDERHERSRFNDKQMHDTVCDKCGNDCQVPFRPTRDKPVFCNNCFGKNENRSKGKNKSKESENVSRDVMNQLKVLNTKMDNLIKILAPDAQIKTVEKVKKSKTKTVKKVEKPKVEKKKKEKTEKKVTTKKASTKKKASAKKKSSVKKKK